MTTNSHRRGPQSNGRRGYRKVVTSGLVAMTSFLAAVVLVAVVTWFGQFWILAGTGVLMTTIFWSHRKAETWGNAICFLGVFILLYALLAIWLTSTT